MQLNDFDFIKRLDFFSKLLQLFLHEGAFKIKIIKIQLKLNYVTRRKLFGYIMQLSLENEMQQNLNRNV